MDATSVFTLATALPPFALAGLTGAIALATVASAAGLQLHRKARAMACRVAQLEQANALQQTFYKATLTGTWEWDITSDVVTINCELANMLGYTVEELTPMSMTHLKAYTHSEDANAFDQLMQRTLASPKGEPCTMELRMRHKNGQWIWVARRASVTQWTSKDKPLRMIGAQINISERKTIAIRDSQRSRVLQMLAADAPIEAVVDAIARAITEVKPQHLCAIRIFDSQSLSTVYTAAPYLPTYFTHTLDGFSHDQLARSGEHTTLEPRITCNIATDAHWAPYRGLAERAGLSACWEQPIVSSSGHALGTIAIYQRTPGNPTQEEFDHLEDDARLTALVVEKTTSAARQQLAASVFSHAHEGIAITDPWGTILEINQHFTTITGYKRTDAIGKNMRMLNSAEQSPDFFDNMWKDLQTDSHWVGEIWNRRKSGDLYAQMTTISGVRDSQGCVKNYVALFTDVTALKNHQRELENIAHYDALTGLPNRVLLADRLQQGISHSTSTASALAVAYLDLDGFKAVNDNHGHNVGDELLITVARRMRSAMREGDTLARIGGDEFIAVMAGLESPNDAIPILNRLLVSAATPVVVGDHSLKVSASIGVSVFPNDNNDADVLMRHADQAMYIAKQRGKNRYHFFDVEREAVAQQTNENINELRDAIQKNEFVLHFQPKVNLRDGAIIGAEALIRWEHPSKGLLAPGLFLPYLEDEPLSITLGEWVIDTAMGQMAAWEAEGLHMPVSVNISAYQLHHGNIEQRLKEIIQRHPSVPPSMLELEVLENSALQDMDVISSVMHSCRNNVGVQFALDDFGTGYSSLSYLKHLPAAMLKIDQSFIRDMLTDPDDLAIVKGVIALTEAFKRGIIAEGVETDDHCTMLLELGCELAQGYGIARPMPADEIPAWVKTWNATQVLVASRTRHKPKLVAV